MSSNIEIIIKKMLRRYGQKVQHKKRIKNIEGEEIFYTYEVQEPKLGQFSQITSTDQIMERWGIRIEADVIGTFLPDTDVNEGDLLYIDNEWYEVQDKVVRRTGDREDFIEVLLRRKHS